MNKIVKLYFELNHFCFNFSISHVFTETRLNLGCFANRAFKKKTRLWNTIPQLNVDAEVYDHLWPISYQFLIVSIFFLFNSRWVTWTLVVATQATTRRTAGTHYWHRQRITVCRLPANDNLLPSFWMTGWWPMPLSDALGASPLPCDPNRPNRPSMVTLPMPVVPVRLSPSTTATPCPMVPLDYMATRTTPTLITSNWNHSIKVSITFTLSYCESDHNRAPYVSMPYIFKISQL